MKAKELEVIEWEDQATKIKLFGTVQRVLSNSVIVNVIGVDDSTVVKHKRYKVIKEGEVDESTAEEFKRARREMGARKWF